MKTGKFTICRLDQGTRPNYLLRSFVASRAENICEWGDTHLFGCMIYGFCKIRLARHFDGDSIYVGTKRLVRRL